MGIWFIRLVNIVICLGSGIGAGWGVWETSSKLWGAVLVGILVSLGITMFYGAMIGMVRNYRGYF